MSKSNLICTLISRASDGLILCEASDYNNQSKQLQDVKLSTKKVLRQMAITKQQSPNIKQIQNKDFGIYFKSIQGVVYVLIGDGRYPVKLANIYLDAIISSFTDELKNTFAGLNYRSKLETIETSHYFVKFDRIIKLKRNEFEDANSSKNLTRMKNDLENIKGIVKISMQMLENRTEQLEKTVQKARQLNDRAKEFKGLSKKLQFNLWLKQNLFWFVLILLVGIIVYLKFM